MTEWIRWKSNLMSLLLISLAALTATCRFAVDRPQPNVVVILMDTLRPDYLGFYGYEEEKGSSLNFPVKSPYGSPRSVKLLIPPTCLAGEARCEAPRLS